MTSSIHYYTLKGSESYTTSRSNSVVFIVTWLCSLVCVSIYTLKLKSYTKHTHHKIICGVHVTLNKIACKQSIVRDYCKSAYVCVANSIGWSMHAGL